MVKNRYKIRYMCCILIDCIIITLDLIKKIKISEIKIIKQSFQRQ